jgi:hypothetical protein
MYNINILNNTYYITVNIYFISYTAQCIPCFILCSHISKGLSESGDVADSERVQQLTNELKKLGESHVTQEQTIVQLNNRIRQLENVGHMIVCFSY